MKLFRNVLVYLFVHLSKQTCFKSARQNQPGVYIFEHHRSFLFQRAMSISKPKRGKTQTTYFDIELSWHLVLNYISFFARSTNTPGIVLVENFGALIVLHESIVQLVFLAKLQVVAKQVHGSIYVEISCCQPAQNAKWFY